MNNPARSLILLSGFGLAVCAAVLSAGPLQPAAGPVGSTMKTLTEVEPRTALSATSTPGDATSVYKITAPGSYYLTGNIDAPAGKSAVNIAADNVTLDLNGFKVNGPSGTVTLINAGFYARTTLRNGKVVGGGTGVSVGEMSRVASVDVMGCSQVGFSGDSECTFTDCGADWCGNGGFYVPNWRTVMERCHAGYCTGNGFSVGKDSRLVSCTATHNTGHGFDLCGVATGCTSSENGEEGFITTFSTVIESCTARDNTGTGFKLYSSTARGCTSLSNSSYGYDLIEDSTLTGDKAAENAVSAVRVSGSLSVIEGCTLRGVGGFPVVAMVSNVSGVRIERNSLYQGTYAVTADPTATGTLIVGNQCVANASGAFSVNLANNQVGPTVSAGGTIASTNPWANYVR
jgi:hypothetical protein